MLTELSTTRQDRGSTGLRVPYRPKYVDRAEHHQTGQGVYWTESTVQTKVCWQSWAPPDRTGGLLGLAVRRKLSFSFFRHDGCDVVKCVIQMWVHGERGRGKPKSNMTPRIGNVAKRKKTELKSKQHHRVTYFASFSLGLFISIQRDYRNISNDSSNTGTKFVGAQNTEISISADGDFGEMRKTETPSKSRRVGRYVWAAVFTFNPYLLISINELLISLIHLLISINELLISINELLISINMTSSTVFIDIYNSFNDINKGIIDINNSFIDINKYGWRCHIYWSLSSSFPFVRGEVLPATFSPPHLIVFSTLLCLLSSSSSLPPRLPSSHLS